MVNFVSSALSALCPGHVFSAQVSNFRTKRPARRLGRFALRPVYLGAALLGVLSLSLHAQTAYFSGSTVTLGSGFIYPTGLAVDSSGNVFVADYGNSAVKEIEAAGGYTTVNTLSSGFINPVGVAVDDSGNVYVADPTFTAVKEILAAGGYTTVNTLGSGFNSPQGVAVDGSGNVYVADPTLTAVKEILAAGGYTTVNTLGSGFNSPQGVAVDGSGNVYVADPTLTAVKEILAAGGYTTVNTLGSGFSSPQGVAVDGAGNVYVADTDNSAVKEILAAGGYTTVETLGSGFSSPKGVAVDGSGNVFVADYGHNAVKEIQTASVNFGSQAVGTASASRTLTFTFDTGGAIEAPAVLTQGATGLDFTDAGTGTCTTNGAGHSYSAGDTCTVDVTFKPTHPGLREGAVELLNSSGAVIATAYVYGTGSGPQATFANTTSGSYLPSALTTLAVANGNFNDPHDVAVDASGNIFVADTLNSEVKEIVAAGGYTTVNTLGSGFYEPEGVAIDGAGNVFVADSGNSKVKEIVAAGGYTTVNTLGSGFTYPSDVAVDRSGNVFVADDSTPEAVKEIVAAGGYTTVETLGSGFSSLHGMAVDSSGNVFFAQLRNGLIKEMVAAGGYTTVKTLSSGLQEPFSVAVDGSGNVFVADYGANAVKEIVAASGYNTVETLDSGLSFPQGVAVDGSGNVYVTLHGGNAVKELDYADPPSLSFASTDAGNTSSDSPQTVTVENDGNATLTFELPAASGAYNPSVSSQFAYYSASTCTQTGASSATAFTLAAGASCTMALNFAPTSVGSINGSAVITDDNLNAGSPGYATQTVSLSGTGTAGAATHFVITGANPAPFWTAFTITITAEDAYGNTDTTYNGTVALSSSAYHFSNTAGGPVTLSNGVAQVNIALGTAGTETVTATDTTNSSLTGSGSFDVPPGAATHFAVSAPASTYVESSSSVSVTAQDIFNNVATGYTGTVQFTSTDAQATLPSAYTFTGGDAGAHSFTVKFGTTGSQSVTATDKSTSSIFGASGSVTVTIPNYVVTTAVDDGGSAGNCTVQAAAGTGTDRSCSLRDALLAAAATGSGNISFDQTVFAASNTAAQNTITLGSAGTLTIPSNTSIVGATSGSGATLKNLVTVSGGGSTSNFSVFTVNSGVTGTSLANLVIENGHSASGSGGGINNHGALSVSACTFMNNSAFQRGGAIFNSGTLTVTKSTFARNSNTNYGGAISNQAGKLTVTDSTFSGNSAAGAPGGAIFNNGTLTVTGSTFSGNSAKSGSALDVSSGTATLANDVFSNDPGGECNGSGCPTNGTNGNIVDAAGTAANLSALGNHGGPTETMIPLPGSAAICTGSASAAANAGITADQRGVALNAGGYCASGSVDAGAVQTDYALKFVQQPTTVVQNIAMTPAPTVELDENGAAFTDSSDAITIPLTLTTGPGTVSGGSVATSTTTGIATYSALSISLPGTGDQLTASLALNPAITPNGPTITALSGNFDVNSVVTQLAFSTAPSSSVTAGGNAGSAVAVQEEDVNGSRVTTASDTITLAVSGPGSYAKSYTATAVNGVATFDLSSDALTAAGSYSYTASIASSSVTNATAGVTVTPAAAATLSAVSGSGQSAAIGAAFAQPLAVKVVDQYGNAVPNATVTFSAPASGASATFSTPAATDANGDASVTATANGIAGTTAYTVTASVSGASTAASFMLTNTAHSTTLTVAPSSASLAYGQPVTVTATISPASVLGSKPSGTVTFYDGATTLSPAGTVDSSTAQAGYTVAVPTVGNHTYAAQYSGDTNFQQSAQTSATQTLLVNKANSTLSGPTSPVSFTYGAGGTITIDVAGQYTGAGIATPGGTVSYAIGTGAVQTAAITAGVATLTIPAMQNAGSYTVAVSYAGDGNYNAATSINVPLTINQATATINVTPYSVTYDATAHTATGTATGVGGANLAADLTLTATTHTAAGTYATDAWSFHDPNNNYADASGTVSDVINTATLTIAANNASKVYGTANPAFSGTISGQQPGDTFTESFSTTATLASPVGSYAIVPAAAGANLADYTVAATNGTLSVTRANTATTLALSSNSITSGQSVTLSAQVVSATTGTPTGTVSFYDGATLLGTSALSGGTALYSTAALAPGLTHTLTASYAGDINFNASVSSASVSTSVAVAPLDFTMNLTTPADVTVVPGQSVSFTVEVTPMYGSYADTVHFAMSGLPPGATASFSPSSIAANGGAQTVTVTITTAPATAMLHREPPSSKGRLAPFALAFLLLFGVGGLRKRSRRLRGLLCVLVLAGAGAAAILVSGCSGHPGFFAQSPHNYNVTLTATSANLEHSVTLNLNVQ